MSSVITLDVHQAFCSEFVNHLVQLALQAVDIGLCA